MSRKRASRFLISLGQALSTSRLYTGEHPALERANEEVWERARELLGDVDRAVFTFLEGEVALGDRRLPELRDWPWAENLADIGVQRIEVRAGLDREELDRCLAGLEERLDGESDVSGPWESPHVRFGALARAEERRIRADLEANLEDVDSLYEQARLDGEVSTEVVDAVVESVARAIGQSRDLLELLVPLKDADQYSTVHSMNVSILALGFAELMGFDGPAVKKVGESALLHDMGKTHIPDEILKKPESLSEDEWEIVQRHPEEGARLLLQSRDGLVLPALVAYEHHMYLDGSGYPARRYPRKPHPVSQMVQICDVFDALRTERPFREAWPTEKIYDHLVQGAGTRFDPDVVDRFVRMLRQWDEEDAEEEGPGAGGQEGAEEDAAGSVEAGSPGGGGEHAIGPEDEGEEERPPEP